MQPIAILRMAGSNQPLVDISNDTAFWRGVDEAPLASYELNSSGVGAISNLNQTYDNWDWLLLGVNSDYQVRATLQSGSTPSGTLGSWVSLNTTRQWVLTRGSPGVSSCSLLIEIRKISNSQVIDSATIAFDARYIESGGD